MTISGSTHRPNRMPSRCTSAISGPQPVGEPVRVGPSSRRARRGRWCRPPNQPSSMTNSSTPSPAAIAASSLLAGLVDVEAGGLPRVVEHRPELVGVRAGRARGRTRARRGSRRRTRPRRRARRTPGVVPPLARRAACRRRPSWPTPPVSAAWPPRLRLHGDAASCRSRPAPRDQTSPCSSLASPGVDHHPRVGLVAGDAAAAGQHGLAGRHRRTRRAGTPPTTRRRRGSSGSRRAPAGPRGRVEPLAP